MRFCSRFNLTWSLQKLVENAYFNIDVKKQEFTGQGKFLITKYLLLRKDHELNEVKKHCTFIFADGTSQVESLNLIKNRTADGNIRPTTFYIQSDQISFVGVFKSELYNSFQFIDNKPTSSTKQTIEIFIALKEFIKEILIIYLISFLTGCLILFLAYGKFCDNFENRKKLFHRFLRNFLGFKTIRDQTFRRPNAIGIFFIFLILFQFLVQSIIQNSINLSSIIVDTSFLITSIQKIQESKRKLCFFERGQETNFFEYAPKNTLPFKIFDKLGFANYRCHIFNQHGKINFAPYSFDSFFNLAFLQTIKSVLGLAHASTLRNAFLSPKSYFEILRTLSVRDNLPDHLKKNIDECVKFMSEHGLIEELYTQAARFFNNKFKHEFRTFRTVKQYLDEYIFFNNLGIQNFKLLFQLFFFIQLIVGLIFVVDSVLHLIRKFKRLDVPI